MLLSANQMVRKTCWLINVFLWGKESSLLSLLKDANSSRKILSAELNKRASSSELNVAAVGHAHIDTGWLWPVKETIRKCARTFTTQLDLIDRYIRPTCNKFTFTYKSRLFISSCFYGYLIFIYL